MTVPISHGEGRFIAPQSLADRLQKNGQIATQYCEYNPNGSYMAIEGTTSPDGRVFGKMGHAERRGKYLYRNVPGRYDMKLFESAVKFFN